MTGDNMRINKGGAIDAKGWSFKISQWMVERTKTEAVKFRNVGNEVNNNNYNHFHVLNIISK